MRSLDGRHAGKKYGKAGARKRRCNQCRKVKATTHFKRLPDLRVVRQDCNACTEKRKVLYSPKLTIEEKIERIKIANPRIDRKPDVSGPRVIFKMRSTNKKLGPIPMSVSEPGTCPRSCAFYDVGCYAGYGWNGVVWRKARQIGIPWDEFLERVRALPRGTLWRHNEAGDLGGIAAGIIHEQWLFELVVAAAETRAFTYTHRRVIGDAPARALNRRLVKWANGVGFTINLSADSLEQADEYAALGVGPVVVTLPSMAVLAAEHGMKPPISILSASRLRLRTPAGRKIVVCPAQTDGLTCAECRLCAHPKRKSIIGFVAHGQGARLVSELVRSKRGKLDTAAE